MNLPNKLTIFRIILTFFFMALLFTHGLIAKVMALITFIVASITDLCDGYFARKYNLVTDLGKLLDPIADKILVLAAFLAFVEMKIVPAWIVVIIIMRELLITGVRLLAVNKGKIIEASLAGKQKTVSQMVSIFVILGFIVFREIGGSHFKFWNKELEYWFLDGIFILMLITVAFTVISGVLYVKRNHAVFTKDKHENSD